MISRNILPVIQESLAYSPALALLGPRQVGKTTLALEVAAGAPFVYLDLESERDRARLAQPEIYLAGIQDRLVILDEVHRMPGLFPSLRGLIDDARRAGRRNGLYLLLGSASLDLLKQSGETLAGRISYLELTPFHVLEPTGATQDQLWVRGGFPESVLAAQEKRSLKWREDFIRTYLERDVQQFGLRVPTETLRRLWVMLAHHQGGLLNAAQLARSLGQDVRKINAYLDLLVDLLLVRRLQPWSENVGKRLIKAPKIYVRDSGILHALLNLADRDAVLSHPIAGESWEGFVIENLLAVLPSGVLPYFYRTSGGAELDLLLVWPSGEKWAIEIKLSLAPKLSRGFHSACEDLKPSRKIVVYPGTEPYPLAVDVEVLPLVVLAKELAEQG